MRHRKQKKQFGRPRSAFLALARAQARSLILHDRIQTTTPKAKELRRVIEPLITIAKTDTLAHRRLVIQRLGTSQSGVLSKLFKELGPKYAERKGGYTRVIKLNYRKGDHAEMALIEFV